MLSTQTPVPSRQTQTAAGTDHYESTSPYVIESTDEIHTVLKKIYNSHILLSVLTEQKEMLFSSLLLELNLAGNYIVLDELYPRDILKKSLEDTTLKVYTKIDGIDVSFSGIVQAISNMDGSDYYKLNIPSDIIYKQRRNTYRVPISITKPITAAFSTMENILVHAELRDLSLSGLSARLKSPAGDSLKEGDEIPTCIIQAAGKKIICSMEIIRVVESSRTKKKIIGARFTGFNHGDHHAISQLIMKLDWENIKQLKREAN